MLWSGIEEIYAAILAHPFLRGLTDASLERETFQFCVVQDAHYLREYARALSVLLLDLLEVCKTLLARGSPDRLYSRWIETYGGGEFGEIVQPVLDLTDRVGPDVSAAEQLRVARCFITTSRYEWRFWDMEYRREQWPV
jgi:thiaminase